MIRYQDLIYKCFPAFLLKYLNLLQEEVTKQGNGELEKVNKLVEEFLQVGISIISGITGLGINISIPVRLRNR